MPTVRDYEELAVLSVAQAIKLNYCYLQIIEYAMDVLIEAFPQIMKISSPMQIENYLHHIYVGEQAPKWHNPKNCKTCRKYGCYQESKDTTQWFRAHFRDGHNIFSGPGNVIYDSIVERQPGLGFCP